MIDFIVNDAGAVTIAHTLRALDGVDTLDIDASDGRVRLSGDAGAFEIGVLQPSVLRSLRPGLAGRAIRTSGWSIARVIPLAVRIH